MHSTRVFGICFLGSKLLAWAAQPSLRLDSQRRLAAFYDMIVQGPGYTSVKLPSLQYCYDLYVGSSGQYLHSIHLGNLSNMHNLMVYVRDVNGGRLLH